MLQNSKRSGGLCCDLAEEEGSSSPINNYLGSLNLHGPFLQLFLPQEEISLMGRGAYLGPGALVAWEEDRGEHHTELHQGRQKAQSSRLTILFHFFCPEKNLWGKRDLICHASSTPAGYRGDEMPDLCMLSEDKHMPASQRGACLICSHAFPWEWGSCFGLFFFILLLRLFLKYPASWRLGLRR